ncbi:MAG: PEP-CTERM sorting domain-containing protein [Pirellulales bacterium]
MSRKFFAGLIVTLLAGSSAQAATVTYQLVLQAGNTFSLFADVSTGDNGGLVSFGVPLTGNITAIDNKAPFGQFGNGPAGSGAIGFADFRSADGTPGGPTTLAGSQVTVPTPTPLIVYGFGQTAGNLSSIASFGIFGNQEQLVYGAPLLLATGSYTGAAPGFNTSSLDLYANVFTNTQATSAFGAQVLTEVVPIPEPSTFVLAAIGLAGLLVVRRRSR